MSISIVGKMWLKMLIKQEGFGISLPCPIPGAQIREDAASLSEREPGRAHGFQMPQPPDRTV